jgi:hypothetical protein
MPGVGDGQARMWIILLDIGGAILGIAVGAGLGLLVKNRLQKSKGARAGAMMALAFMGMFTFIPPETTTIAEPSEEMKIKKGANPGDPPEPEQAET